MQPVCRQTGETVQAGIMCIQVGSCRSSIDSISCGAEVARCVEDERSKEWSKFSKDVRLGFTAIHLFVAFPCSTLLPRSDRLRMCVCVVRYLNSTLGCNFLSETISPMLAKSDLKARHQSVDCGVTWWG